MVIGAIVKPNFEWDPHKAEKNISKHDVAFDEEKFYQEAG
jgi:uncharacterized DUF497 family protein